MVVGRNEPCPCGSGKKYKKCCAKRDAVEARLEPQRDVTEVLSKDASIYKNWLEWRRCRERP